jgi:hypothetical protein
MKWRDEASPAVPTESPDLTQLGVPYSTDAEILPAVLSVTDEQSVPERSIETVIVAGDSNTSTPRPSREQTRAHVLIVDDNDINLKVCLPRLPSSLYRLVIYIPFIVRTTAKKHR